MAAATFPNSPVNGDTVVINATTYVYNSTNNSWDIPVGAGLTLPLTSLSVGAEGTPSGDGELSYDNTTGVFTYTPPVISEGGSIIQGNTSVEAVDTGTGGYVAVTVDGTETARFDSAGDFQFNSGYGSVATAYGCRAWVNFNGSGTVAIRASGNVSSITDNGTSDYTVNFTTAMPDINYALAGSGFLGSGSGTYIPFIGIRNELEYSTSVTTTSIRIVGLGHDGTYTWDWECVNVSIFR